jgi:hypothetical protein
VEPVQPGTHDRAPVDWSLIAMGIAIVASLVFLMLNLL